MGLFAIILACSELVDSSRDARLLRLYMNNKLLKCHYFMLSFGRVLRKVASWDNELHLAIPHLLKLR